MENNTKAVVAHNLTTKQVLGMTPKQAELALVEIISQEATIKKGGKILRFSSFNENPDPLVNLMLARILIGKIDIKLIKEFDPNQVAILSIENSASYLSTEIVLELERQLKWKRPPCIIRARKSMTNKAPSPAMGEYLAATQVYPITSPEEAKHLVASMPDTESFRNVRVYIVVDDFRATGHTLIGGIELVRQLISQNGIPAKSITVIPMAALGKPEQLDKDNEEADGLKIKPVVTAVDVHFWAEPSGCAMIRANGFAPMKMRKATARDFEPVS
jgi:hypothetical protein